jgi:hypothetical protein
MIASLRTVLAIALSTGIFCAETPPGPGDHGKTDHPAAAKTSDAQVLFDAAAATDKAIPDPFGGAGVALKAGRGHHQEQQLVLSGQVFLTVPAERAGKSLVFRLAVTGPRSVRIVFTGGGKSVSRTVDAPEEGAWCDVAIPLAALGDELGTGAGIDDITLFQKDAAGSGSLFLKSVSLAATPK